MKLYEKRYGEWYEQHVDLFGHSRWEATSYVPRTVRDAARRYANCRVEYDHFDAVVIPPPPTDPIAVFFATELEEAHARVARDVAARAEREVHQQLERRARAARTELAIDAGLALGGLVAGLFRNKNKK